MAERVSTGFANAQLTALANDFRQGVIAIYSGTQPTSADEAEIGVLLCLITKDGGSYSAADPSNGLTFGSPSGGVIDKSAEVWSGTAIANGIAGWFRFYAHDAGAADGYTTGASTTAKRFDGAISTSSSAELQMLNTTVAVGGVITVSGLPITYPKA